MDENIQIALVILIVIVLLCRNARLKSKENLGATTMMMARNNQPWFGVSGDDNKLGGSCTTGSCEGNLVCETRQSTSRCVLPTGSTCKDGVNVSKNYCQLRYCDTDTNKCLIPREQDETCGGEHEVCVGPSECKEVDGKKICHNDSSCVIL